MNRRGALPVNREAWVEQIMGMPVSIHLRGPTARGPRLAAVDAVFAELRAVDRVFSTYREDSDISRLRRGATTAARCDPTVREVLDLCAEARIRTGGFFDVYCPGPHLDPSGLVKGWAAERAARHLAALDRDDHYLNAGGDIVLCSRSPQWRKWRIGIEHPDLTGAVLGVVPLAAGGIATSGTARRGAHIVEPRTGRPATALRAVTVTGPSLLWADVYATAVFARGPDGLAWLAGQEGYEGLTVGPDGAIEATVGMRALLHKGQAPEPSSTRRA